MRSLRPLPLRLLPLLLVFLASPARADGPLTWLEAHFHTPASLDGLQAATDVEPSPDGLFVYVAGRRDDAVSWFARDESTGALGYGGRLLGDTQPGGTAPDFDRPFALSASPDGAHLYVIASDAHALVVLDRDATSGALAWSAAYVDGENGADPQDPLSFLRFPRAVAVRPDGACVAAGSFGSTFEDAAVIAFARDAGTGALTPADVEVQDQAGVDVLLRVRGLAWDPSGTHLYVASVGSAGIQGEPASVSVFEPDESAEAPPCALRFVESEQQGVAGVSGIGNARDVAVSPDGAHVYVAGGGDDEVDGGLGVFARDAQTGALTFLEARPVAEIGDQPNGVAVTPDGGHVLVAAQGSSVDCSASRLTAYQRDAATGLLTLVDSVADDELEADGLRGAFSVATAPDGRHAFVAAEKDSVPEGAGCNAVDRGALAAFRVPEPDGAALAALALGALAACRARRRRA